MISLAEVLNGVLERPGQGLLVDRDQLVRARDEIERLQDVIEKQKETIVDLELACATLRRRVESLEADRCST
jgi:hypothetical protein